MKAAFIERPGPPEAIVHGDLPDPIPGPRDVVVRVRACAVNPIDTYIRSGAVTMPLPVPFVVGCDLAGEVVAVGADVNRVRPGMRVWGSNQGLLGRQGTFSELAAVDERWLYPTPDGVSDHEAAAAALVSITAHLGLVGRAGVRPGETVFVNGGSGGVGSAVVQIAKALGARVIATAGAAEKQARVRECGADEVLDYRDPEIVSRALAVSANGVDVYWETQREPDFDRAVAILGEGGRMVVMAGRDARPAFPVGPFYVKGCTLHGFVMFKASHAEQAAAAADINRWLAAGRLRVPIDRVLPLARTAEAHTVQELATVTRSGGLMGKIVVEP
ncbi:MAG: NADPH:quinone reductase [Planctomycetes bacterium]|nr:NADPH:quinone reductase [Planctomycetota bacterium]